jgi:hypothetical protein
MFGDFWMPRERRERRHPERPALQPPKHRRAFVTVPLLALAALSCARPPGTPLPAPAVHPGDPARLHALSLRFAPVLFLHPEEPYQVISVLAVFHPSKPLIAYHIFFEDDAFLAGRGKRLDHEIAWVEYDPVTLKVTDVFTLWHRTVLETESRLQEAKVEDQRPRLDVQWGQHGLLPPDWRTLVTIRPKLELWFHYQLMRLVNRLPKISTVTPSVRFRGSYAGYLVFTREVPTATYIRKEDVVVAEYPLEYIRSRVGQSFLPKKEWPDW